MAEIHGRLTGAAGVCSATLGPGAINLQLGVADATTNSTPLVELAERWNIPVATTFHGKGVFPDDHHNALGAVGFMRHDYANFGFDSADVIVAVGYELQEFDPVKINPACDAEIIHVHRFPA